MKLVRISSSLRRQVVPSRSFVLQRRSLSGTRYWLIPVAVCSGVGYAGYQYVYKDPSREIFREDSLRDNWQLYLYTFLPLNMASRLWGKMNSIVLPVWLRSPILRSYIWMFDCDLNEASNPNLDDYENLGQFFRRSLVPSCRPIDEKHQVTCPSDGVIVNCGPITSNHVEQVKGVTYTMSRFLGPQSFSCDVTGNAVAVKQTAATGVVQDDGDSVYEDTLKFNKNNNLYHCIIYLAPGNYHRFHSPANWKVTYRRHFHGNLLSVNPIFVRRFPELFNLNERAIYFGEWKHGFFSMTMVGATNVGSIKVYNDKDLVTNESCSCKRRKEFVDRDFLTTVAPSESTRYDKGQAFGEFNLGSTIVLVFEAPKSFSFAVTPGQKIKYGSPLGT